MSPHEQMADVMGYAGAIGALALVQRSGVQPAQLLPFADSWLRVISPVCAICVCGSAIHFLRVTRTEM